MVVKSTTLSEDQFQFLEPTCWLTTVYNFMSMQPNTFHPLRTQDSMRTTDIHSGKTHTHKQK